MSQYMYTKVTYASKCNYKRFLDGHIRAHESTFSCLWQPTMTSLQILNSAQARSLITILVSIYALMYTRYSLENLLNYYMSTYSTTYCIARRAYEIICICEYKTTYSTVQNNVQYSTKQRTIQYKTTYSTVQNNVQYSTKQRTVQYRTRETVKVLMELYNIYTYIHT